jgi:hypothetical protein
MESSDSLSQRVRAIAEDVRIVKNYAEGAIHLKLMCSGNRKQTPRMALPCQSRR